MGRFAVARTTGLCGFVWRRPSRRVIALYGSNPGYPAGTGSSVNLRAGLAGIKNRATSADDTHSFIHWALRRAHENLREPLDAPAAVPRVTVPVALLDPAGWRDRWAYNDYLRGGSWPAG